MTMPIVTDFKLPASIGALTLPGPSSVAFFIAFITADDPQTNQPWCPDVRAALPHIKAAFSADSAPDLAFVSVGQRPEWKDRDNIYRTKWNVHNVPTVVRYESVSGAVKETGRLVEDEILDEKKLSSFIRDQ